MAAVAEMGEVDDMLSKEEGNIVTNGDVSSDLDMETQDIEDSIKKPTENSLDTKEKPESGTEESNDASEGAINENHSEQENPLAEEEEEEEEEDEDKPAEKETPMEVDASPEVKTSEEQEVNEIQSEAAIDESSQETKASEDQTEDDDTESKTIDDENSKQSLSSSASSKKSEDKVVEIHEIDSDDDEEDSNISKINNGDPIELNDSGGEDGDVLIVDTDTSKPNGRTTQIIDLATPEKKKKEIEVEVPTPRRRSSRNLNKTKSYAEDDKEEEEKASKKTVQPEVEADEAVAVEEKSESEESDIEEILPQDPLACNDAITVERIPSDKSKAPTKKAPPIVVNDTKRLVEIASKSNTSSSSSNSSVPQGKKEPTLVIIDTNSILSGRGPVPVNNKPPTNSLPVTPSYQTVLPMAVPAQGMYPPNMRATITPIPVNSSPLSGAHQQRLSPATITPALTTPLLPTLTDDMFVVEAPSFIVPYVYEKPPVKDFKDFVKEIQQQIKNKEEKEESETKKSEEGSKEEKMEVSEADKPKVEDKSEPNIVPDSKKEVEDAKKPYSYFDSPLGKFFINIGFNLVQEYVQTDLLKQQKRKHSREGGSNPETEKTIKSLVKNLAYSKENNEHFKTVLKKCEFCNFKTESALAMSYHLETPHMKNFVYKCNFCAYEVRSPHDILFHMEAEHAVRGHLERAPAFHQCPNCPFEDNQKGKLSRHLVTCMRKFKPERNLDPPLDWEPPAKIPRVPKMRQQGLNATAAAYQNLSKNPQYQFLSKMQLQSTQNAINRGRGRPLGPNINIKTQGAMIRPPGMLFKQQTMSGGSVLVPTNYQLSGNQVFQNQANQAVVQKKPAQQPSISITPLPRSTPAAASAAATPGSSGGAKPGDTSSKNSFVICEICDGYIKDLEQLRNHMQWIHKIKIHPKMIYNRPPLNCQKCQFRFFTDQGLERHLLGSHGLVTSSMQDAANKSKDSGRCPVCGRVYQWKLLNHVARDHNMTLKPAHLSYKCTVCTATFGMYKQFENHVYSAHSVVAKRVMDKKGSTTTAAPANSSPKTSTADQLKPLKINDEITIIPQPAKSTANGKEEKSSPSTSKNSEATSSGSSRAERLARRNASEDD